MARAPRRRHPRRSSNAQESTPFQIRVWRALQEIPYGELRSYSEVAAALGQPGAARAVSRACAANRLALVIPCHRVIRGDGGLGGYRRVWDASEP